MTPRFRMVAGPNGSGKTTLCGRLVADYSVNFYTMVNADRMFAEASETRNLRTPVPVDAGAFVVVTNAASVKLTGKKEEQKDYQRYSGYRDGLKHFTAAEVRASHPDRLVKEAVWGMLPKNNIARKMMTRLKVFAAEADKGMLAAQKPVEIKLYVEIKL